jgi:hypothetical protein
MVRQQAELSKRFMNLSGQSLGLRKQELALNKNAANQQFALGLANLGMQVYSVMEAREKERNKQTAFEASMKIQKYIDENIASGDLKYAPPESKIETVYDGSELRTIERKTDPKLTGSALAGLEDLKREYLALIDKNSWTRGGTKAGQNMIENVFLESEAVARGKLLTQAMAEFEQTAMGNIKKATQLAVDTNDDQVIRDEIASIGTIWSEQKKQLVLDAALHQAKVGRFNSELTGIVKNLGISEAEQFLADKQAGWSEEELDYFRGNIVQAESQTAAANERNARLAVEDLVFGKATGETMSYADAIDTVKNEYEQAQANGAEGPWRREDNENVMNALRDLQDKSVNTRWMNRYDDDRDSLPMLRKGLAELHASQDFRDLPTATQNNWITTYERRIEELEEPQGVSGGGGGGGREANANAKLVEAFQILKRGEGFRDPASGQERKMTIEEFEQYSRWLMLEEGASPSMVATYLGKAAEAQGYMNYEPIIARFTGYYESMKNKLRNDPRAFGDFEGQYAGRMQMLGKLLGQGISREDLAKFITDSAYYMGVSNFDRATDAQQLYRQGREFQGTDWAKVQEGIQSGLFDDEIVMLTNGTLVTGKEGGRQFFERHRQEGARLISNTIGTAVEPRLITQRGQGRSGQDVKADVVYVTNDGKEYTLRTEKNGLIYRTWVYGPNGYKAEVRTSAATQPQRPPQDIQRQVESVKPIGQQSFPTWQNPSSARPPTTRPR